MSGSLPSYVAIFTGATNRDRALLQINVRLNEIVEQLSNSRRQDILNLLNMYPVMSVGAHSSPFSRRWMNLTVGLLLPVGVCFYARAVFFRRRLQQDFKQIEKTNQEIQYIINERILK